MTKATLSAFAAALLLAGCSTLPDTLSDLNPFSSKSARPKMADLPELRSSIPVRVLWQASVGTSGNYVFSPAVVAGGAYAAARDGTVARFDAANGRQVWRVKAGQTLSGGVGCDGAVVAVGTEQGEVILLDAADGGVKWRARVSSEVLSAPVVTGDLVVVRSADSRLFALDVKDGKRRWLYQRSSPTLAVRSPVGIVVSRGMVFAGFSGGKLVGISLSNGAPRWEATVALPRGSTELERVTDVVGLPIVTEREVCAVAYQGRVGCHEAANGNGLWSRELSSTSGLDLDVRYVFVSDDKDSVHALDRSGGTSVWKQDRLFLRKLTAPLALGREIAVGDVQGYIHFLSRETGAFVGRAATDGSQISANLTRIEGGLLIQTRNGNLYALATQ